MFREHNFTFNGIYSRDLGVSIATFNDNDMFHDIGIEYTSEVELDNNLVEYNPYYVENSSDTSEIELNLLLYNPITMEAVPIDDYDINELYDWLITDDFSPFISDDNQDIIYYFKVIKLQKVLTFNGTGYLRATFKPYSKYCYKREEYEIKVTSTTTLEIYNPSRQIYKPIIEITNLGGTSTINKINNMEIVGLNTNEIVKIDNLTKLVIDKNNINKFNLCNRKWIELKPRETNVLTLSGNMNIKIICEFPIIQ